MKNYLKIFDKPSDSTLAAASNLGIVARLMCASPVHFRKPIAYLTKIVEPAFKHEAIKLYFNARGEPVGYVIWAFLAAEVEQRCINTGAWDLHISEWNEGDALWIIDLVAPFGNFREILVDMLNIVFPDENTVRYFRVKNGVAICKELNRST